MSAAFREGIMRVAVLLPFLAATQCLELSVIFCIISLKVRRRPENLAFSLLAFFLGGMIGCELLLQEADSLPHGLFWYRLQFVGIFSSCSLLLSFISLVIGRPAFPAAPAGLVFPFGAAIGRRLPSPDSPAPPARHAADRR